MKYPFIARHRAVWSVSDLCRALGVSRSGFYEWHGRAPSAPERANTRLTGRIRESSRPATLLTAVPGYGAIYERGTSIAAGIAWQGSCTRRIWSQGPSVVAIPPTRGRVYLTPSPPTCSTGTLQPTLRIRNGRLTLPTFGLPKGGCTSRR